MSNERFASVWDAIESTPALAANMRLRSSLMIARKWTVSIGFSFCSMIAKSKGELQLRATRCSIFRAGASQ